MRDRLAEWLGLRPPEVRTVALAFSGAFLAISFAILARSLREALYLTSYPVETLPYITAGTALLSIPTVAWFAGALARGEPRRVLFRVLGALAAGLAALWAALDLSPAVVIAFYAWTDLGTLLITSGFWLVTAELFPVRGAKRLFGLIGAGGTAGAMITGNAVAVLSARVPFGALVPALIVLLALFWLVQRALPSGGPPASEPRSVAERGRRPGLREGWRAAWGHPHLRTIGAIVAAATVASTLVDYQFKEAARASVGSGEQLAGFFGAFYGWAGAASLAVQLLLTRRFLGLGGVGLALSVLPLALLAGSIGFLVVPGLVAATLTRGADTSLRKSLHRSAIEVLYVPIPTGLRRRTKTFIDSVADSAAEGVGAGIVFLVVTLGGLSSRLLSGGVLALTLVLLWLARRARHHYLATVTDQLRTRAPAGRLAAERSDLVTLGFGRADVSETLDLAGAALATGEVTSEVLERLESPTVPGGEISRRVAGLVQLLASDAGYRGAVARLAELEEDALPLLRAILEDPGGDFAIRRRIPAVLARFESSGADAALLDGIRAPRFEVRYRSAVALVRRRRAGCRTVEDAGPRVWEAIRREVSRERPVWEFQRLLDHDEPADDLAGSHLGTRGQLSLEHAFRLLSLVLDPEAVGSAYHGLLSGDERLRSLALEYLEQVLPSDVRERLWPFIGDLSAYRLAREARPVEEIVSDLVSTDATFIMDASEREELLRRIRRDRESE